MRILKKIQLKSLIITLIVQLSKRRGIEKSEKTPFPIFTIHKGFPGRDNFLK
ncbi:MAG: hypothetical protein RBG13Loki_2299 [Promethearchaeota archaeon CR_4]|nr:MAG: hypothetical protein RBG13Loki_2299 [Candidatus Lokiarchaeota archaeon CR_4]